MLTPPIIGLIIFGIVSAGAFVGWLIGQRLPTHHTTDETKSLVSLSMAVVGTVSALVLGLLIANANVSFIARNTEVTALSVDIIRLDRMLRLYGPEADPARKMLRRYADRRTLDLFPEHSRDGVRVDNESTYQLLQQVEDLLLALHPADHRHEWLIGQAMMHAANIGNTTWLLTQQSGQGVPRPFLCLVVFWLTLLFASFGLFAPRNLTSALTVTLCAMAIAGAVEMILELEQPFAGLVHLSPLPMRSAIDALSR